MYRQAFLQAADHIDKYPESFRFYRYLVPANDDPGTQACALGWVGHYAKLAPDTCVNKVAFDLGTDERSFYNRLKRCAPWWHIDRNRWMYEPKLCAKALRKYANRFFPETLELAEAA